MVKNKTTSQIKKKKSHVLKKHINEADGVYFLKLICVIIFSTVWIKLYTPLNWHGIQLNGFPAGSLFVLILIRIYEKDQFDRKIWYAAIIIVTIISYFLPAGIVI